MHRGSVMRKMRVKSLVDVVLTAESPGIRGQEQDTSQAGFPEQPSGGAGWLILGEAVGVTHFTCQLWNERLSDLPLISIVDDDDDTRAATESLVNSRGLATCTFASAESCLRSPLASKTSCLILDVQRGA
jgi:hypothetical protein